MHQHKDASALKKFNKALKLAPGITQYWIHKGFLLRRLGRYEEALGAFDEAIHLEPTAAKTWHHRGLTLMNMQSYPDAHDSFE